MKYQITGKANADGDAHFSLRENFVSFGIAEDEKQLANPAELLLGSFAACCLKSIERFSKLMSFKYKTVKINVTGVRQDAPPKMMSIEYVIHIESQDKRLNVSLLHKNIQRYGTIYNTLYESCEISGKVELVN